MVSSRSVDLEIEFVRLPEIATSEILSLMIDERVRRHLPLMSAEFDETACARFVEAKERMWREHGYGPWAFRRGGSFVGWGGLQPEGDDADLGLILHPSAWGIGSLLVRRILSFGFTTLGIDSVIALLPPTRRRRSALERVGFRADGEFEIGGERFLQYRLLRGEWVSRTTGPPRG